MRAIFKLILTWILVTTTADVLANGVNYFFRRITPDDGLAHTDATGVVQDDQGFIWFGTNAGLQRYDGSKLQLFWNNETSLSAVYNNRIQYLEYGERGKIWLGTEGGLKLFDTRVNRFVKVVPSGDEDAAILSQSIRKVKSIGDNDVIILNGDGIYYLEIIGGEVRSYNAIHPMDLQESNGDLFEDSDGNIWAVGRNYAVFVPADKIKQRNGGQRFEIFDQNDQRIATRHTIFQLDENTLVLGTVDGFVEIEISQSVEVDKVKGIFYPIPTSLKRKSAQNLNVSQFEKDRHGNVWLGTNDGLFRAHKNAQGYQFQVFRNNEFDENSLVANHVNTLKKDKAENLWITTYNGGVSQVDLNQQQFFNIRRNAQALNNTLAENFVRAISSDENGLLWLGNWSKGLQKYDPKTDTYTNYSIESGHLSNDNIRSLVRDQDNNIWIGTTIGMILYDRDRDKFIPIEDANGLLNGAAVFSMAVDYFGNVWAGTWNYKGLINITKRGATYETMAYTEEISDLCSDRITFIYADPDFPQLFVGTNKGLNHILLDDEGLPATIFQYKGFENDSTSLSSNFVWPIVKENNSVIWVGTLGGGLNRLKLSGDGQYVARTYGMEEGAPSNDIESLEIDNEGNLWIGSKGLSRFDPETETFTNFNYLDGLQGNSFKIGASHKSDLGKLYFGGINGLTHFWPADISKVDPVVEIALTDIYINNELVRPSEEYDGEVLLTESLNLTENIELSHSQNDLNILFTTLNYRNPQKTRYRYKMLGIDDEWNELAESNAGIASYLNLPHGNYEFLLQSATGNGPWMDNERQLSIVISPAVWNTPFARILYVVLGAVLLVVAFLIQKRWFRMKRDLEFTILEETKMEELHQMRLKFFTNISHEFKTPLTLIVSPIEKLLSTQVGEDERSKLYKLIHGNATRLLNLMTELLDFRKVETGAANLRVQQGNLEEKLKGLAIGFEEIAERKGLKLSYAIDLSGLNADAFWYDKNVLEKIVINLFSNALNYTESGSVDMEVSTSLDLIKPGFENSFEVRHDQGHDSFLYIRVKDTGVGITKASLPFVFDRYYRVSGSKNKHLGSGVGLALVRSLVELHKGNIFVSSERKVGSEFVIALPIGDVYTEGQKIGHLLEDSDAVDHEEMSEMEPENQEIEGATEVMEEFSTILVVDDNEELLGFLKDTLSLDYRIMEANNGEEALEKVQDTIPDLIISDVMMPVMDGMQLCENIKSDINYSHIPFILLTAKTGDENKVAGTSIGADAYFSKPFNLELLQNTIHNILENRRRLKERYRNDTFAEEREMVNTQKDREFMDHLIEIVNDKMDDPAFDIHHLCMEMGYSRTKLYNKIKNLTNLSVGEFIRRMRMKRAAEILLKEDVSVYEVMLRVGMQSQSYFTKTFRKEFGSTPAQYKNHAMDEDTENVVSNES